MKIKTQKKTLGNVISLIDALRSKEFKYVASADPEKAGVWFRWLKPVKP